MGPMGTSWSPGVSWEEITMGIGIGVLFIVLGLTLLLGVVELPSAVHDVVETGTLGWILLVAGILAIILGLVMNKQRARTTHVEERREV